ncbi:MAG: prephenate dehydratase [Bacteroidia bacterium]|nr:prephenate dehydratase [Bacteroidia bacterium]
MAKKVIIQGYRGAFHEIAARHFFGDIDLDFIPANSFPELVHGLEIEDATQLTGVMAIENTLYGSLLQNLKLLRASNLTIIGEVYLRVAQQLMGLPGSTIDQLTQVRSHPIAIAQCEEFFEDFPEIKLIESSDTAYAAKRVKEKQQPSIGAIASKLAARIYGLEVLSDNIETNKHNYTRFLVIEKQNGQQISTNANKVSIVFRARHEVGSLHKVLGILSAYSLNMTKIHSAPIVGEVWRYKFFIDFELDGLVGYQHAIEAIRPLVDDLRVLGIYKRGEHYEG